MDNKNPLEPYNDLKFQAYLATLRTVDEQKLAEPGASLPMLVLAHAERLERLIELSPNHLQRVALCASLRMDLTRLTEAQRRRGGR